MRGKSRTAITALIALLALCGPVRMAAAFGRGDKGTSGAQFLKIAPGARPSAMGEAFAGVADDVHAIYYNPAGLGNLRRVEVTGMHNTHFQGVSYDFAALSVPILSWVDTNRKKNAYGVLGAAIYSLSVGDIERRGTTETDEPLDTFAASDFAYALSYAWRIPDTGLALGATAKFVDSKIDTANATAFAADVGALYRRRSLALGIGARNVGTKHKFVSEADPLPVTLFGGIGYKFTDGLLGALEINAPRDNNPSVAVGGEYKHAFADKLNASLRAGYNRRHADPGGLSGAAFGAGVGYGNFEFDFAFVPFGDLGDTYKYSLVVKF